MNITDENAYKKYISILYKDKVLGRDAYTGGREKYEVKDFVDLDTLLTFLSQTDTSESFVTPAGKSFLKYYWGWDILAEILVVNEAYSYMNFGEGLNPADDHWKKVAHISDYLKNWTLFPNQDIYTTPPKEHDDAGQVDY